ncbi:hypothetical protein [uncultured Bilophila sp.]|uniref:hypothetical protein n=1 Tax=uncultured Bilophila sp. TaxID=529385 RepID=UPI00262A9AD5|nr:hypothetical protein [uncultured Bilophila sp.]
MMTAATPTITTTSPTATTATQYASPAPASSGGGGSTATFRTIRRTFWTDPYIESMPPARKLLYIYLFTSPHTNNLGVLNTTARRIAFETGMTEEEVKDYLNTLEQQDGKIALDGDAGSRGGLSILVINFIKHQCTTSPKLVMSLRALFGSVESEKIRAALIAKNPHLLDGMDRVADTVSIRSGEIDQDQIQENKKRREEIISFPCGGDGREKGKRGKGGRQGKGYDIVASLPPPPPHPLNATDARDRKEYVQYTPPSSPRLPSTASWSRPCSPLAVDDGDGEGGLHLQDIPLDLLEALQRDYPTIDVSKEIDRAREWARNHTSPEKPLRNAWRFITAWLRNAVAARGAALQTYPKTAHRMNDWTSEKKNMTHGKGQTINAPEKAYSWAHPQPPKEGETAAVVAAPPTPEQLEENAQRGLAFLARWKKEHGYAFA